MPPLLSVSVPLPLPAATVSTPTFVTMAPVLIVNVLLLATPEPIVKLKPSRFQFALLETVTVLLELPDPTVTPLLNKLAFVTVIVL